MTYSFDYTLHSSHVHRLAVTLFSRLPLEARGDEVGLDDIINVLLFASSSRTSVYHACQQLDSSPSSAMVLGELARQLDDLDGLEEELNALLASLVPKRLGSRGRRLAVDLVKVPYHGGVRPHHEEELCRSKATCGTSYFFTYATAYVVHKGRRYTLAITRVRKGDRMVRVLKTLLRRIRDLGIKLSLLLVDRGFYSVRVIRFLIRCRLPFIMAAPKKGKVSGPEGATGTRRMAQAKSSYWTRYTLRSPRDGEVRFDLAVVCRNLNGKWNRHERQALLYASWGVNRRSLGWVKNTYRKRFGIESSYRQLNQARIRTSTRNPTLRLLFVGIAFILRNLWVWLHGEVIALPRQGARVVTPSHLRFQRLLVWLMFEVAAYYQLLCEVPIPKDFYEISEAFGFAFNY